MSLALEEAASRIPHIYNLLLFKVLGDP